LQSVPAVVILLFTLAVPDVPGPQPVPVAVSTPVEYDDDFLLGDPTKESPGAAKVTVPVTVQVWSV